MKEAAIRKKAVEILGKQGWAVWWPPKVKWRAEGDIFGIGDMIVSGKQGIKLIQLTTLSNLSARRKKIKKVLETMELSCLIEIWAYDKKKKVFKTEKLNQYI